MAVGKPEIRGRKNLPIRRKLNPSKPLYEMTKSCESSLGENARIGYNFEPASVNIMNFNEHYTCFVVNTSMEFVTQAFWP